MFQSFENVAHRGECVLLVPHVLVRDTIGLLALDGVDARDLLGRVSAYVAQEMAAPVVADLQQSRRNSE